MTVFTREAVISCHCGLDLEIVLSVATCCSTNLAFVFCRRQFDSNVKIVRSFDDLTIELFLLTFCVPRVGGKRKRRYSVNTTFSSFAAMVGHHRYGLSLDSSSKVRSVLYVLQHLSRRHLYVVGPGSCP